MRWEYLAVLSSIATGVFVYSILKINQELMSGEGVIQTTGTILSHGIIIVIVIIAWSATVKSYRASRAPKDNTNAAI